jgi:hypothetical protein
MNGLFGMLTVLFVGLKLTEVIAWSWWLVLAPMWIPIVILIALVLVSVEVAK